MRFEIIDPFVETITSVCQNMGITIIKDKVLLKTGKKISKNISFYFKIKGDFKGIITYEIEENLAKELIKKSFNVEEIPEDREFFFSGIAEIGNIVNGKLLENIYKKGLKYSISHPLFSKNKGRIISYSSPCVEIYFKSQYGNLILSVVFESIYV